MYNKKTLSKASAELDKAKAPKKPKDMITDLMGQWKYPGLPTRIPSNDITMKGVGYPVLGVANNGQRKIMLPGADYTFPGADYVDEYPQMRKGGAKKKKTRSLSGTNKIMLTHPLLQNYKNKVYDPNVDYFQDGGVKKQKSKKSTAQQTLDVFDKTFPYRPHFEKQDPDSFFENIVEIGDFTGLISWDDVSRSAIEHGWKSPQTALEIAGAIPFVGKVGKAGKAGGKLIKTSSKMFAKTARQKTNAKAAANLLHYGTKGIQRLGQTDNIYDAYSTFNQYKKQKGGVSSLEGDLISKVVMERNKDKDFVQRGYALGKNPGTAMFNAFDPDEFGQTMSHKMAWGEDDNGQAYMFPTVMNPKNEAIKVPNQYADYISSEGYKRATGMIPEDEYIEAELTDDEIEEYRKGGYIVEDISVPELNQAQKGIISTKEHTDKKGNKTIKVQKEDGTVYTKVIGKDGKVYNRTFNPKKDSWATDQTKNLYSKPQGAGNSDWFWGPAALTAITAAPLVKSAATAVGEGIVAGGDAIANATLNKLGKNSFLQATKAAYNAAPSWLPSGATANNLLTAAGATYGTAEYFDKNSDIRKSYSKVAKDPTLRNVGDAVSETGLNMLNFSGLNVGKNLKNASKYATKVADKVAHGETILPYAWKSRAQGVTSDQAQELYQAIKNKKPLTEWQHAMIRDYAFDSSPYTGRWGNVDEVLRSKLNNLIKKTGTDMPDNTLLIRKINAEDPKLFNLKNKTINFGDRPVSFSAGRGADYNGPKDRIVLSGRNAKKASKNFIKNEHYTDYSDDVLNKIPEDLRSSYKSLPELVLQERELIGTDLNLRKIGKVKNELGGHDYIMKPKGKFFESGGQVELELSDDEIQDYINQGYIVEEVDEPEMQSGGELPYKLWEEKTGTPWSEAKRQGLTDGSYEQNVALAQKLLADATSVVKENLESKPSFDYDKYDQIVSTLVQKGNTLEDLVAQQIGTKEGLMKRYPNLFSASNSKSKAVNTVNIPTRSVDEILKRTAAPVNLKTPDSRMKSETIQYQNIPVKKLNLISDSNLKPKPVNNTVKQFERSKQVNQTKLKEAELKNYVNAIRDSLTPDSIKKQKQLQNSFFPTAPKKKLTVREPLTQETTKEFRDRMLKMQQGLNLKPIASDTEKVAPIKNFQDLQGEPGKFDTVSPNLPEVTGKQFPVKKPVVKAKPPQDITKFQNTLKPEISFKKGSKITEVKPETEEKVVKEDSGYKVISNLTNRMGSYDQSLQNLYYDYTNPKHSPEKRKQVKAAFDNKLKERNNLITTINSKKRDYAGVLDSWIDESAPAWVKKPAQKGIFDISLADQVEASSYKLPKFETYKEKEEKENEKFRTSKRFDDLGGNEKGSRWQFRVAASNDDPMKVQVYGTRSERNPDLNIKSKGAVMHFLDQSPLTGYVHPTTQAYYRDLKPDGFVGKLEKQKDGNYTVKYVPKKDIPAKDLHKNTFLVRQEKFDNIDFNKKVADRNFLGHTYWTKKGSTKATIPVSSGKDANVYDYASGQSVVFIFPYKGKTRYVHYAGSPNAIKKEGEEIKKLYKLQANKLVLGVADAGSYSSSVKGNITDKKLKDWTYGYANTNGFTGAGMALVD